MKSLGLSLLLISSMFLFSCTKEDEKVVETKYVGCSKSLEDQGECIRWMDRKIYLAFSNAAAPQRNNEFQKQKIKEALAEISLYSSLGYGYFNFEEVDESFLSPIIEPGLSVNEYKSFIVVYPDDVFNNFVVNEMGGSVPDFNAITVINSAYKRKFYIIIRASCFDSQAACNSVTTPGLKALIARQLGFLVGLAPANCTTSPNNTMCADLPVDAQWSEVERTRFGAALNNNLEVILNNNNFYDEYVPTN